MFTYRMAVADDVESISDFVDYWLSGRGKRYKVPGAVNDCFVSKGQHKGYIRRDTVLLCFDGSLLVAWAVRHHNNSLIHLLVAGPYRGKGIGSEMIRILKPKVIRSKSDQSSGDPAGFYVRLGYVESDCVTSKPSFRTPIHRRAREKNIKIFIEKPR